MRDQLLTIINLVTIASCQYMVDMKVRPDVVFNDGNDRFDIEAVNKANIKFITKLKHARRNIIDDEAIELDSDVSNIISNRRVADESGDYVLATRDDKTYDDTPDAEDNYLKVSIDNDYRRKLKRYVDKLHGYHEQDFVWRRSQGYPDSLVSAGSVVDEVLAHKAVPFKLKIRGYVQP